MRGLSEEHLALGAMNCARSLKPLPYPDEEALRAELELMNMPGGQIPPGHYINISILDEIKKNGFVDKLYK